MKLSARSASCTVTAKAGSLPTAGDGDAEAAQGTRSVSRNLNNVNLLHFAAFRAVMLTGTVSGAAEIIGKSQPAVSRLLDRLEHDLAVRLFDRRKGLVTPTPEAYLLLEDVERTYLALESLRSAGSRLSGESQLSVNLAVMPTMGTNFMPEVVCRFAARRPRVKVSLNIRMSPSVEEQAAASQIDIGLAERPLRRSGYQSEVFSDAPYVGVVPRGHPLEDRPFLTPEDLRKGPLIAWTRQVAARTLIDQALQSHGLRSEHLYETSLSVAALELVKRGLGIALIDPFSAMRHADERVRLIPFMPKIPFNVALLRPEHRDPDRATEIMLEVMHQTRDEMLARLP
jgi:DNA-binding transcriptional LysR family regulator